MMKEFMPFLPTDHGPLALIFGRLINSIRQFMKYFSSFDANLSFYFIVRIDIYLFNRFCSNFCRCDDNFYTDVNGSSYGSRASALEGTAGDEVL